MSKETKKDTVEANNEALGEAFYRKSLRPDRQRSYKLLGNVVVREFNPKTVVDYGCGGGWLLYNLLEQGIECTGIESNFNMKHLAKPEVIKHIKELSLTKEIDLGKRFDLAISLEVVEHIDAEYENIVIENICRHSDTVFFSAATPGQGGPGHVNEQPFKYWEKIFNKNNFQLDAALSDSIRKFMLRGRANIWYRNNLRVLRRK